MGGKTFWLAAVAAAAVLAGAAVAGADPAPGDGPPVGLERLKKPDDKGKLPVDGSGSSSERTNPSGTRSLGHGGETPSYSPGKPGGDGASSDPGSIGGGTRVGGEKSPLDDIH